MTKKGALIVAALLLIITVFAGCGTDRDKDKPQVQAPIRGGILTIGTTKEPTNLNPFLVNKVESSGIENIIFSGLLKLDKNLNWQPDLAIEVPTLENGGISADGKTITYKLKQNIHWHDGRLFNAEDVLFTYKAALDPKISLFNREEYKKIINIQAPDLYTVRIIFDAPNVSFQTLFNSILPQHILDGQKNMNASAFNMAPVGTGPFMFKHWNQGQELILDAYPEYHSSDGPYLEQIKFKYTDDQVRLVEMLEKEEIDVIQDFSYALLDRVKAIKGLEVLSEASLEWEHLDFNLNNWILQDKNVRQAIAYALDRQAIINTVFNGQGEIANTDVPAQSWAYNPNVKKYSRDLNKAKDLLEDAGWKDIDGDGILEKGNSKLQLKFSTSQGFISREQVQEIIVRQLKEVGIEVLVENYPNNVLLGDILRNQKFDLILYSFIANPEPNNYSLWHSSQLPPVGQNYLGYKNPEMDAQLELALNNSDMNIKKQALFRAQEILVEELPVFPLYYRPKLNAFKQEIKGVDSKPISGGLFGNVDEWWIEK